MEPVVSSASAPHPPHPLSSTPASVQGSAEDQRKHKDNSLKSEYMGTDGAGCSYRGYVRPPKSQRVRPIRMSQDHIILDTSSWHFLNANAEDLHLAERMAVLSAASALANMVAMSMPPPPGCTIEPCDDEGAALPNNQREPQQEEVPYRVARSPDGIDYDKDTCPMCHGYLPFGPQCFPCIIMSDEPERHDEDADDEDGQAQ